MNNVYLSGRLVKEPELLGEMKNYLRNAIAVSSSFKDENGEYKTDFFNFVAFSKTAELMANYLKKGDFVMLRGHLTQNSVETKQGYNLNTIELVVDNIEFVPQAKKENNYTDSPYAPSQDKANKNTKVVNPFENNDIEFNPDDLPF